MPSKIPREDLLTALRQLAETLGRAPTRREMDAQGRYSGATYATRFGSWAAALEAAGFESRPYSYSTETLLAEIHRLVDRLDRVPTIDDLRAHGAISVVPYRRAFGTWPDAIETAGHEPQMSPEDARKAGRGGRRRRKRLWTDTQSRPEWVVDPFRYDFGPTGTTIQAEQLTLSHERVSEPLTTDQTLHIEDESFSIEGFVPTVRAEGGLVWLVLLQPPVTSAMPPDQGVGMELPSLLEALTDGTLTLRRQTADPSS